MAQCRDFVWIYHVLSLALPSFDVLLTKTSFFHALYMALTEFVTAKKSKGEVLVFRRGHKPAQFKERKGDFEATIPISSGPATVAIRNADGDVPEKGVGLIQKQTSVFHWR